MAIAFAEVGERDTALQLADLKPTDPLVVNRFLTSIEDCFSAVAFAEANCHHYCEGVLKRSNRRRPKQVVSLKTFLKDVGLQHVQVRYGVAII
ncbi:MAG: hypothetical protein ABIK68_22225 [bacterium]